MGGREGSFRLSLHARERETGIDFHGAEDVHQGLLGGVLFAPMTELLSTCSQCARYVIVARFPTWLLVAGVADKTSRSAPTHDATPPARPHKAILQLFHANHYSLQNLTERSVSLALTILKFAFCSLASVDDFRFWYNILDKKNFNRFRLKNIVQKCQLSVSSPTTG
jgi:hypothetical protein